MVLQRAWYRQEVSTTTPVFAGGEAIRQLPSMRISPLRGLLPRCRRRDCVGRLADVEYGRYPVPRRLIDLNVLRITANGVEQAGDELKPIVESLERCREWLASIPVGRLLALFDDFAGRLLRDPRTAHLEGAMFLSAWLKRRNLEQLLALNLNGNAAYLDGFVPQGRSYLAAKPHGLVAAWMAGNVATLPMFSLVPALLAKNVCLVKLAQPDPAGMDALLAVLAESEGEGLRGAELLEAAAVVWFDYHNHALNEQMSLAADAKIVWGGAEAVRAISRLPRREHCVEIIFGPKYSIGVIGRKLLDRRRRPGVGRRRAGPRHCHLRSAGVLGAADDLRRARQPPFAARGGRAVRPAVCPAAAQSRAWTPTRPCESSTSAPSGPSTSRRT